MVELPALECTPETKLKTEAEENRVLMSEARPKWFCSAACDIDVELKALEESKNSKDSFLGDNKKYTLLIDSFNDNPLHGALSLFSDDPTADDLGRTFGVSLGYKVEGDDGELDIAYTNHLFARRALVEDKNGKLQMRDSEGRKYGEATEESKLTLTGRKNRENYFLVGELSLAEQTDQNRGLQSIQNSWHNLAGSAEYNYVDHRDSTYAVETKVGIGVELEKDIGKWKCRAVSQILAGTDALDLTRGELSSRNVIMIDSGSFGGRAKDNPWIGLSAMANLDLNRDGLDSLYGINAYTSIKLGDVMMRPNMGVFLFDESLDREFSKESELIHSVGVEFKF